eukprot:7787857-Pyramimonas_sp.AAC.1
MGHLEFTDLCTLQDTVDGFFVISRVISPIIQASTGSSQGGVDALVRRGPIRSNKKEVVVLVFIIASGRTRATADVRWHRRLRDLFKIAKLLQMLVYLDGADPNATRECAHREVTICCHGLNVGAQRLPSFALVEDMERVLDVSGPSSSQPALDTPCASLCMETLRVISIHQKGQGRAHKTPRAAGAAAAWVGLLKRSDGAGQLAGLQVC